MVKTIYDALIYGKEKLEKSGVESFLADSKILLCYVLNCEKNYLIVHKNDELNKEQAEKYIELIEKRSKKFPVKYITGICEFYSLDFIVNKNVLIPRPETEFIVDRALAEMESLKSLKILDLCCGSGCIGITLCKKTKESQVTLVDISDEALGVAKKNVEKHKIENSAHIIKKDILIEEISGTFDLIVSNPPYINEKDYESLEDDVKLYEPEIALISPVDEYKFYKRIIDVYSKNLLQNGIMLLEMGYNQWEFLYNYAKKSEIFKSIEIIKDYSGINRILYLKK